MFDPDEKRKKLPLKVSRNNPVPSTQAPEKQVPLSALSDGLDTFRYYCLESSRFRAANGVTIEGGKVTVTNQDALNRLTPTHRQILREVCVELCKRYRPGLGADYGKKGGNGGSEDP